MEENHRLTHVLAFALLTACSGMGLCLSFLGLTWSTGELPFGTKPLFDEAATREIPAIPLSDDDEHAAQQRYGEVHAARLYRALESEREQLARERDELEERRRALEEYESTIRMLETELQAIETRVQSLLTYTDKTEETNVTRMSALLKDAEPDACVSILLSMPADTAARVLNRMESRRSATLVSALLSQGGDAAVAKAGDILAKLQTMASASAPNSGRTATQ